MAAQVIDDSNPILNYAPPAAWVKLSGDVYYNSTVSLTQQKDAAVTLNFQVTSLQDTISIYGFSTTIFTVELDGTHFTSSTPSTGLGRLYQSAVLNLQNHKLTLKNTESNSLYVDCFIIAPQNYQIQSSSYLAYAQTTPSVVSTTNANVGSTSSTSSKITSSGTSSTATGTGATPLEPGLSMASTVTVTTSALSIVNGTTTIDYTSSTLVSTTLVNASGGNPISRTAAIIGSILGAIILLLGLVFIWFRWRKRRKRLSRIEVFFNSQVNGHPNTTTGAFQASPNESGFNASRSSFLSGYTSHSGESEKTFAPHGPFAKSCCTTGGCYSCRDGYPDEKDLPQI